jgi:hypothetical protein
MPQLPEQIRPVAAAIAKHHFWILAAIVPLVLVPMLLMGTGSLDKLIGDQRSQIDSRVSALKGVQGIAEHPNEGWSEAIEGQIEKIRGETVTEWERLWQDQQFLRAWPPKLGDDFLKAVAAVKPGGTLKRDLLLRYQNTVPELVRELPKRMGADDLMVEGSAPGGGVAEGGPGPRGFGGEFGPRPGFGGEFGPRPGFGGEFGPRPGGAGGVPGGSDALVAWSASDQKRLYDSFKWEKPPTTTQVLLAQEELWVYGLFCDAIKKINEGAAGAFNAPVSAVVELAVGYPAAEDQPGGQGTGRVFMPAAAPAGGGEFGGEGMAPPEMVPGMGMPGEAGGAVGRPLNPRFTGGASPAMGMPMMAEGGVDPAAAPVASPDEQLKEWIYVDFSGKPLTAAELATVPAAKMVHLMPFVLRVTMDQRKLDALLADLATGAVPIDVRQVRINPTQQGAGSGGGFGRGEMAPAMPSPMDGSGNAARPFDVTVELRGTVGLAPPPDKAAIGGTQTPAGEGGA